MSRERIVEVLAGHEQIGYDDAEGCTCDPSLRIVTHEQYRAHIADAMTDVLADVWDETCQAVGWAQDNGPIESALLYVAGHNPYRTANS